MELWIRSQDRYNLIRVKNIRCSYGVDGYKIIADDTTVGNYSSEKRTLEVLDEIQNILNLKDMYKYDRELVLKSWENVDQEQVKIVRQLMCVYEMPKE